MPDLTEQDLDLLVRDHAIRLLVLSSGKRIWEASPSPLQEEEIEGQTYQVQWFERDRFELHPENAPPFNVLLGLLGQEATP